MSSKEKSSEMGFLSHLAELRKRILFSLAFIAIAFFISWYFVKDIYNYFAAPLLSLLPQGSKLAYTELSEPFMLYIKLSFFTSLFLSSPFVFHQLWLFISPALYKKEKKYFLPFVFLSTMSFIGGGFFGYYIVFPLACDFFLQIGQDFNAIIKISSYFTFSFRIILGIAIIFEMPALVFLLTKLNLLNSRILIKYFKYAVVLIFVIAAVITPTPDMITQSVFAFPMILLYAISILIAKIFEPK